MSIVSVLTDLIIKVLTAEISRHGGELVLHGSPYRYSSTD